MGAGRRGDKSQNKERPGEETERGKTREGDKLADKRVALERGENEKEVENRGD